MSMDKKITNQIESLMATMDLPSYRKESWSTPNIRWLIRNMGVRNADHKNYDEAMTLLKGLL